MEKQNFECKNQEIRRLFQQIRKDKPQVFENKLNLSWSNWGFGLEPLEVSVNRLAKAGIKFIELHGNHYGCDLGYKANEVLKILKDHDIKAVGICGMFSVENDLSSNSGISRQNAIDYIKHELDFAEQLCAEYMLIVPGAVGRPTSHDDSEFERSVQTLRLISHLFIEKNIKAAIEPIRSAEVSFCHTIADAKHYIKAIDHPGIQYINGDVYHMQTEENHIGMAILEAGNKLINLHLADSNRCALGNGSLDIDTIIMALYIINYNRPGCYITPEPLGPGGDPYPAMHCKSDPEILDKLVNKTVTYFRQRENVVLKKIEEID